MKKHRLVTAFYVEALLLVAAFVIVILVLTRTFGLSRTKSGEALLLTNAVTLAQNAADAVSASSSSGTLLELMDRNGNAVLEGDVLSARYGKDMTPDPSGELLLTATWKPEESGLVRSRISVFGRDREEPLYVLETAVYTGEVGS